jgi:hypothetical protein
MEGGESLPRALSGVYWKDRGGPWLLRERLVLGSYLAQATARRTSRVFKEVKGHPVDKVYHKLSIGVLLVLS